jgi:hypothetical protein
LATVRASLTGRLGERDLARSGITQFARPPATPVRQTAPQSSTLQSFDKLRQHCDINTGIDAVMAFENFLDAKRVLGVLGTITRRLFVSTISCAHGALLTYQHSSAFN